MLISGIKPSGIPHIGNYFGSIKQQIESSHKGNQIALIADYHALTTLHDPEELNKNVFEILKIYLSLGYSDKSLIIRQSAIPELHELSWILSTFCGMGILNRAHAYKASLDAGINCSAALHNYPILMAADILLLGSAFDSEILVPVGKDQNQHIEIAQQLATTFNEKFEKGKKILKIPKALVSEIPIVYGIDGNKMSKSLSNTIPIVASENEISKIISKIVTDSKPLGSPLNFDTCNIIALLKLFKNESELKSIRDDYENGKIGYGHAKLILKDTIINYFASANKKYKELENFDSSEETLRKILENDANKVRDLIRPKLLEIRRAVGLS